MSSRWSFAETDPLRVRPRQECPTSPQVGKWEPSLQAAASDGVLSCGIGEVRHSLRNEPRTPEEMSSHGRHSPSAASRTGTRRGMARCVSRKACKKAANRQHKRSYRTVRTQLVSALRSPMRARTTGRSRWPRAVAKNLSSSGRRLPASRLAQPAIVACNSSRQAPRQPDYMGRRYLL